MELRKLEEKDAELMFEWMHDSSVVEHLQTDFESKTIEDCKAFIKDANNDNTTHLHMAIINDQDEYMGTVSLKNITKNDAEFAITIRKVAMGQGYSRYAMKEIIRIGFEELKLNRIYWCVNPNNKRAIRFYDKGGYMRTDIKNDKYILTGGVTRQNRFRNIFGTRYQKRQEELSTTKYFQQYLLACKYKGVC